MVVEKTSLDAVWILDRFVAVRYHLWRSIWREEVEF